MSRLGGMQWVSWALLVSLAALGGTVAAMLGDDQGLLLYYIADIVLIVFLTWGLSRGNRVCAILLPLVVFLGTLGIILLRGWILVGIPVLALGTGIYLLALWSIFTRHAWQQRAIARREDLPVWPRVLMLASLVAALGLGSALIFMVYLAPPELLEETDLCDAQRQRLRELVPMGGEDPLMVYPDRRRGLEAAFTLVTPERLVVFCGACDEPLLQVPLHEILALELDEGRTNLEPSAILVEHIQGGLSISISPVGGADHRLYAVLDAAWRDARARWVSQKKVQQQSAIEKERLIPIAPEDRERIFKEFGLSTEEPLRAGRYEKK